jgi:C_GCAxxG_C_C family probable redox protein
MNRRKFLKTSTAGLAMATGMLVLDNEGTAVSNPIALEHIKSPDPDLLAKAIHRHFIAEKRTCGEAMLLGGCEVIDVNSAFVPDIALGMGGGIGFQGHICGIVTGATIVIGLVVGSREVDYKKKKMRVSAASGQFLQRFMKTYGTLSCGRICGLDLSTPEGRDQLSKGVKLEKCVPVIQGSAQMLGEILNADEKDPAYEPPRSTWPKSFGPRRQRHFRR